MGAVSIGMYVLRHRLGLSISNVKLLSGSSALFSICLLGHGAFRLSRQATPESLLAIIKSLFIGSKYSYDDLAAFPIGQRLTGENMTSPIMKRIDSNGNLQILIRVICKLTVEKINNLKIKSQDKVNYHLNPEVKNVIIISQEKTDDSIRLKQDLLVNSKPIEPIYCSGNFTDDNSGEILTTHQAGFDALRELIKYGMSVNSEKFTWQLDCSLSSSQQREAASILQRQKDLLTIMNDLLGRSIDTLPIFSIDLELKMENMTSDLMQRIEKDGRCSILVRVVCTMTKEQIDNLKLNDEDTAKYKTNPKVKNMLQIFQDESQSDSACLTQENIYLSKPIHPMYCNGRFTDRRAGNVTAVQQESFNALKQLIRQGQSFDFDKFIWTLDS